MCGILVSRGIFVTSHTQLSNLRHRLANQDLVPHVVQIKPEALMGNKELKYLVQFSAAEYLPESVVRRTDKMGFTTPIGDFINRNAHLIRERVRDARFCHFYNLNAGFQAENKFSWETFGLLIDTWLNRYADPA